MRAAIRALVLVAAVSTATCTAVATPFLTVSDSPGGAYEGSLASDGRGGFVATWHDSRDGHDEIYARRLDASGTGVDKAWRLTHTMGSAYEPDVVVVGDAIVVGWYDKAPDAGLTPRLGAWNVDGSVRWSTALAQAGRNTVVAVSRNRIFAAWITDDSSSTASIWSAWWRLDGTRETAPVRVAAAGRTTWNLNAVVSDGEVWLVFDAVTARGVEELFLARVAVGLTTTVVQLTPDDGYRSKYPDIDVNATRVALTWFDERDGNQEIYLAIASSADFARSMAATARRITNTPGDSIGAYLAWNGDRLGLAWCDDTPGQSEVYFQDFDPDGRPLHEPRPVASTARSSLIPAIRPSDTGFLLLWNEAELPPVVDGHSSHVPSRLVAAFVH